MRVVPFSEPGDLPTAIEAVREALAGHSVTAVPTETYYGLAVAPGDEAAVTRVLALKGRPKDKALPVVGASLAQLETLVEFVGPWRERLFEVWPAPLTVVLPRAAPGRRSGTLAVRVPAQGLLRGLLAEVGPLTATSANRSEFPALDDAAAVSRSLGQGLALLLDGGRTPGGLPTTVLDVCARPPRMLRVGAFVPPAAWSVEGP